MVDAVVVVGGGSPAELAAGKHFEGFENPDFHVAECLRDFEMDLALGPFWLPKKLAFFTIVFPKLRGFSMFSSVRENSVNIYKLCCRS